MAPHTLETTVSSPLILSESFAVSTKLAHRIGSGNYDVGASPDGDRYSWIAYASQQGFPTLSIDRLGNGASTHPDPITIVQDPAEAEVNHAFISQLRTGTTNLPRKFTKIIYVGHSFGSLIGHLMNAKYPNTADLTLLTGFSKNLLSAAPGVLENLLLLPAAEELPSRFAELALGYVTPSSQDGTQFLFFQGAFDQAFADYGWQVRETLSVGEAVTGGVISIAPAHTNPVLVVTGQFDNAFCNPTGSLLTPANCGGVGGILDQTRSLYPSARGNYDWLQVDNAGHCWQFHYNATYGFKASHDWMTAQGF
jgi:pimeloyl-ACP methyl ester carboxylesterase